ncbi:hypothetical protein [Amycolatopsis decaplanina]|uniref:NlpC/P60 domain-containing protein n=1 Tax=Amycolatopsis decaplanina DSM 44594 TaxID=1284240 RepID=M2YAI7_9PSEU|nr:hypothetical protein [Amycolatopsis decaplanina]EME58595.1 hypothetical protein H074_18488 [Amycolatopsis decaplanina DSM 44594]
MRKSWISPRKKWVRNLCIAIWLSVVVLSVVTIHLGPGVRTVTSVPPVNALAVRIMGGPYRVAEYRYERLSRPARTVVRSDTGAVVATFTDGARSVVLAGPARDFPVSRSGSSVVRGEAWVRLLPQPWKEGAEGGKWFRAWLDAALADRSPDVLATARRHWAGDAPKISDSRLIKLVYGLSRKISVAVIKSDTGGVVISTEAREQSLLQPGDLLLFAPDAKGSGPIDRVGVYLGRDTGGRHRVLFRGSAPAVAQGGRLFQGFRVAKRI